MNQNSQQTQSIVSSTSVVRSYMSKVYFWMVGAIALTGATAYVVSENAAIMNMLHTSTFTLIALVIFQLVLVYIIAGKIDSLSSAMATVLFAIYAVSLGVLLSYIFIVYTSTTIYAAFFTTAGMFGVLSLYGMVTKSDLSALGTFMFMALVGLILATIVNFFIKSTTMFWIINYAGVLIFAGLTAADTQKLKKLAMSLDASNTEQILKYSIVGALTLYLDFINMFLFLLRIFGRSR